MHVPRLVWIADSQPDYGEWSTRRIADLRRELARIPMLKRFPVVTDSEDDIDLIFDLVPLHSGFDRLKSGQILDRNSNFESSWRPWNSGDEALLFEPKNHLMHSWRSDLEEVLKVGLGGRTAVQDRVCIDESEVLALFSGELAF